MSVYADMIRDARTYQEQKQAMRRAEKLLSDLERITFEVMRETNHVMAMEKGRYLEEDAYEEEDENEDGYEDDCEDDCEDGCKDDRKEEDEDGCREKRGGGANGTFTGSRVDREDIDPSLFAGCRDKDSLTKRYRNLMKTFHPDNQDGDTQMTIKVQKTYDYLMKQMNL